MAFFSAISLVLSSSLVHCPLQLPLARKLGFYVPYSAVYFPWLYLLWGQMVGEQEEKKAASVHPTLWELPLLQSLIGEEEFPPWSFRF